MSPNDRHNIEALLTITGVLFAWGFWIRHRELAPRRWPQAKGKIVTSQLIRHRLLSINDPGKDVEPVIEYEFDYEGQSFKTSHWRFGNFSEGNSISAGAAISRYPVGSSVTVFVNTRHPEKSVLESNVSAFAWVPFGIGIFILVLTVVVILAIHS